jgi:hypothetical protein
MFYRRAAAAAIFVVTALVYDLSGMQGVLVAAEPAVASPALRLTEASRRCTSSRQCVRVATRCDRCDCGASINNQYERQHDANLESECRGFHGAECELVCPASRPSCVMGLCILLPEN